MTRQPASAVPGRVESTSVGVWGAGTWTSAATWGRPDPRRDPLTLDRYGGQAYWGRHCWGTDVWLRW